MHDRLTSKDGTDPLEDYVSASGDPMDPVHAHEGSWWFWDEIWVDRHGPYATEAEARAALRAYAEQL